MTLNTRSSIVARNAKCAAVAALLSNGYIRIYGPGGGGQPATPETSAGGTLLAEARFASTAFGTPVNGVATANAIAAVMSLAAENATWFRTFTSDGVTPVYDGSCGTANTNMLLDSVVLGPGIQVSILSLTYSEPMQGA